MIRLFVICFGCCFSSKKKENMVLSESPLSSIQIENFGVGYAPEGPHSVVKKICKEATFQPYPIIRITAAGEEPNDGQGNVALGVPLSLNEGEEGVPLDSPILVAVREDGLKNIQGEFTLDILPSFNEVEEIRPNQSGILIKLKPLSDTKKRLDSVVKLDLEGRVLEVPIKLEGEELTSSFSDDPNQNAFQPSVSVAIGEIDLTGPNIGIVKSISPTFSRRFKVKEKSLVPSKLHDHQSVHSVFGQALTKSQSYDQNTLKALKKSKKWFPKGAPPKLPTHNSVQELFRGSGLSAATLLEGVSSCDHAPGQVIEIDVKNGTCLRKEASGNIKRLSIESLGCCVYHMSEL